MRALCPAEGAAAVAPQACNHRDRGEASGAVAGAADPVGVAGVAGAVADAAGAAAGAAKAAQQTCTRGRRCSARGVGGLRAPWLEGIGSNGCSHPACERIARAHPTDSRPFSCNWDPETQGSLNRSDAYCVHSLLPWADASELQLTVGSCTPQPPMQTPPRGPRMQPHAPRLQPHAPRLQPAALCLAPPAALWGT